MSEQEARIEIVNKQIRFFWKKQQFGTVSNVLLEENLIPEQARDPVSEDILGKWDPHWPIRDSEVVADGFIVRSKQPESLRLHIKQKSNAFLFEYELRPRTWLQNPVYAAFPFPMDDFVFVSFPYEDPLTPPFEGVWRVYARRYCLPLLFGKTRINGADLFVGIGYHLDQDELDKGILSVSSVAENTFLIHFPERTFRRATPGQITRFSKLENPYSLRAVYSLGKSQAECIRNYRELCGYEFELDLMDYEAVEPRIKKAMMGYKDSPTFVKTPYGKAFHQQVTLGTGEPYLPGYGRYLPVGANLHLAEQLYKFSLLYPEETWARDYAVEISGFAIACWRESGNCLPLLYHPAENQFMTYNGKYNQQCYFYSSWPQAVASVSLYRIAEWEENDEFRNVALALAEDLADKGIRNGGISREYNAEGKGSTQVPSGLPLQCLQFFRERTENPIFDRAISILRESVFEDFLNSNDYYGSSADDGALGFPHPKNHDVFDVPNVANFYLNEYVATGDEKNKAIAEDAIGYLWLSCVPRQFKGFKHKTQGLSLEQLSYPMLDVPFHSCTNLMVLPRLSEATGDSFYEEFFRLLLTVQFSYQIPDECPFPAFYIGLLPNQRFDGHIDDIGEVEFAYIVEFLSFLFDTLSDESIVREVFGKDIRWD
jgi:hypothetical protein